MIDLKKVQADLVRHLDFGAVEIGQKKFIQLITAKNIAKRALDSQIETIIEGLKNDELYNTKPQGKYEEGFDHGFAVAIEFISTAYKKS